MKPKGWVNPHLASGVEDHNISPACVLLDAGIELSNTFIYDLWACMWLVPPTVRTADGIVPQVLTSTLNSWELARSECLPCDRTKRFRLLMDFHPDSACPLAHSQVPPP